MRIWIDVYDTDGLTRLGDGPITTATYASVRRALDGSGSIEFSFPATDARALALVQNERRVRIWIDHDGVKRELGRGIVRKLNYESVEGGQGFKVSGPDSMDELTRIVVGRNRQYENASVATVADSLVSLVSGWDASAESNLGNVSARFSGANVLKALIRLAEEKGCHIREGLPYRSVEVGVFGSQQSGLDAVQVLGTKNITRDLHHNDNVILIDRLSVTHDSEAIVNRIYPLGAGEGEAALTLKNATNSSPYTIQTTTINGQLEYYLEDTASIALNGVIEAYVQFKEIGPLANTAASKAFAANMLYDAAAAYLQRVAVKHTAYQVGGKKPRKLVRPGDKIRMRYTGSIWKDNEEVRPVDINDWFWVMSVVENASDSGLTIGMELSTVDKIAASFEETMVEAVEAIQVRGVAVQTYPFWTQKTYYDSIQGGTSIDVDEAPGGISTAKWAKFFLPIDNFVTDITKVQLRFRTQHLWLPWITQVTEPDGPNYNWWVICLSENYPRQVHLFIDDVDVSDQVGGPWNTSDENVALDVTCDITNLILEHSGGIYHTFEIEVRCLRYDGDPTAPGGEDPVGFNANISHGVVEMNIDVLGSAQSIVPS